LKQSKSQEESFRTSTTQVMLFIIAREEKFFSPRSENAIKSRQSPLPLDATVVN